MFLFFNSANIPNNNYMEVFLHKKEAFPPQIIIKQPSNFPYITLHKPTFTPVSRLE